MRRSLTDPILLVTAAAAAVLLVAALRAIARQVRAPRVTADSLIVPPRRLYTSFDPDLRTEATKRRARVEELQQRARRASAGTAMGHEVVPMRRRVQS